MLLIGNSLVHPNEHHAKLQRALVHYGTAYGKRIAGSKAFKGTELEGAEKLDGSLFVRVAGLSDVRLGKVREGEEEKVWDRTGFFQLMVNDDL